METLLSPNSALVTAAVHAATQVIGAIVLWIVGRWLIGLTVRLVNRATSKQKLDPTLASYAA